MAARKKTTRKTTSKPDARTRLIAAALHLAVVQGWNATTIGEIAAEAEVPLDEARGLFADKMAILSALVLQVDQQVLAGTSAEIADEPVRDRIFDVLMRRFDAMAPHRDGIRAVVHDLSRDPAQLACFMAGPARRSLEWMATAAQLPAWGALQPLQTKGLGLVFLGAFRAWLGDDSADLGATMSALDKGLSRAEALVRYIPVARARRAAAPQDESTEQA